MITSAGRRFGTVERVLAVAGEDIFRGIVVRTADGPRFVDRDRVAAITTTGVTCDLDDAQVTQLPPPPGDQKGADAADGRSRAVVPPITGPVSIVACSRGGLFQTVWLPLVSFKAIRLGPYRVQRCPVHNRLELVHRVDPDTLTAQQRAAASRYPPGRVP